MRMIKKAISTIGLLVLCLAAHCQPVKKIEAIRFHIPAVQLSLVQAQHLSLQALQAANNEKKSNLLEATKAGQRIRGLAFEAVARDIYKELNKSFEWVDATYNNGNNGIDGLALKYKGGEVTDVHVIEVKSGNAHLGQTKSGMQLSKKWILHSLDKSIAQKTKKAAQLKKKMKSLEKKAKTSKRAAAKLEKIRKKFEELNKNKRYLKKAMELVKKGRYRRFVLRVSYEGGKFVMTQQEASEDANGKIKLGKAIKIMPFSYLEKDIATLKPGQLRWRNRMLRKLEAYLKDSGLFSEDEIKEFMKQLTKKGGWKSVQKAIQSRITTIKNITVGIGASFFLWSAYNEVKMICDYTQGKITKTDFVFNTITNGLGLATGAFGIATTAFGDTSLVQSINTAVVNSGIMNTGISTWIMNNSNIVMIVVFTTIDVIKNVYNISRGNIRTSEGIINIAATVVGAVAGSVGAWGGAIAGAAIGTALGPAGSVIGGAIGGIVGGIGGFFIGNKVTSGLGHLIVAKYEAYKEPERFHDYCGAVRQQYALAG